MTRPWRAWHASLIRMTWRIRTCDTTFSSAMHSLSHSVSHIDIIVAMYISYIYIHIWLIYSSLRHLYMSHMYTTIALRGSCIYQCTYHCHTVLMRHVSHIHHCHIVNIKTDLRIWKHFYTHEKRHIYKNVCSFLQLTQKFLWGASKNKPEYMSHMCRSLWTYIQVSFGASKETPSVIWMCIWDLHICHGDEYISYIWIY